jgi:hypothetical protein
MRTAIFEGQKVIIELKIIETGFGETDSFKEKEKEVIKSISNKCSFGESI